MRGAATSQQQQAATPTGLTPPQQQDHLAPVQALTPKIAQHWLSVHRIGLTPQIPAAKRTINNIEIPTVRIAHETFVVNFVSSAVIPIYNVVVVVVFKKRGYIKISLGVYLL